MSQAAAFFDLDRTLMAGSSGMHFGKAAYKSGMVTRSQMARWVVDHLRFRLRGSTDADTDEVVRQVKDLLDGVPERELKRMVPDLLAGILPRIYPEMIAEVRFHQDEGRPTFIVSAAGDGIVQLLAIVLDMDGGIGTRYEVDKDGNYTGNLDGGLTYGRGKVEPIRRFAAEHEIDLGESWAYSDSVSDLPMLELVGIPVAVNPDPDLARLAKQKGWRIMRFEKLGRHLAFVAAATGIGILSLAGTAIAARLERRRLERTRRPWRARG